MNRQVKKTAVVASAEEKGFFVAEGENGEEIGGIVKHFGRGLTAQKELRI